MFAVYAFLAFRQLPALAEGGQGANSIWRHSEPPITMTGRSGPKARGD
jgi:hypothetical protein